MDATIPDMPEYPEPVGDANWAHEDTKVHDSGGIARVDEDTATIDTDKAKIQGSEGMATQTPTGGAGAGRDCVGGGEGGASHLSRGFLRGWGRVRGRAARKPRGFEPKRLRKGARPVAGKMNK